MKVAMAFPALLLFTQAAFSQNFVRSELPAILDTPWEITYGADGYLWITEEGGKVVRVDPHSGQKKVVYTAPDYSEGHPSECCQLCFNPDIGKGTLGLALHPDFMNQANAFIYYVYSYNHGSDSLHQTRFKICRLAWDHAGGKVTSATDLVKGLPSGFDHLGGRLLAVNRQGRNFLFLSIGDNGVSETNSPGCYDPDSLNPNYKCQDPGYMNGKIHRFNMDGTVPADNPLAGNSFYTRGHRNPQGLMYNPQQDVLYDIEHGDRSDDEINILEKGMNYGWKYVRGYHNDINYNGEDVFVGAYTPHPGIANDKLVEPLYAWCAVTQHTSSNNLEWGTVAPSDGIYYGGAEIPDFQNSLLVVTLKKGDQSNRELYRFRLTPDGTQLAPSTVADPNPRKYFAADQSLNGRLRDIAVSPDGRKIYFINNSGADRDKIVVYTYDGPAASIENTVDLSVEVFPNPCDDHLYIRSGSQLDEAAVYNLLGQKQPVFYTSGGLNVSLLSPGPYLLRLRATTGEVIIRKVVKN